MSDRIRRMMKERQDAMLAAAQASRPVDLDNYEKSIKEQMAGDMQANEMSPIPGTQDEIMAAYEALLGPSMAKQIVEQYLTRSGRNLQQEMGSGDDAALMRPMISSVMQLDR
jgi:hypothetical protein